MRRIAGLVLSGVIVAATLGAAAHALPDAGAGSGASPGAAVDGGAGSSGEAERRGGGDGGTPASGADGGAADAGARREGKYWLLPSGLRYVDLRIGKGATPRVGQKLTVHYTGRFRSGKVFDTSRGRKPWSFVLGSGQAIRGYDEGVATMRVGGRRKLLVPPSLAYGEKGFKKIIPPGAELTFDVELLSAK